MDDDTWEPIELPNGNKVVFNGDAWGYELDVRCLDCGRIWHATGVAFGADVDPVETQLAIHRSDDCPALKHRWWRLWHRHAPWARWRNRRHLRKVWGVKR